MGDVMGDNENDWEKPVHWVTLSDFYMSAYCVTFEEYDAFCKATGREKPNDNVWGRGNRPVINVNWYDAVEYCNWLSKIERRQPVYTIDKSHKDSTNTNNYDYHKWIIIPDWNANGYRLPTEAEWEYAAREEGNKVRFGNGQNILRPTEANFNAKDEYKKPYSEAGEYRAMTVTVDSFRANALGLYNMSGNVWEWCWDWLGAYDKSTIRNPRGPETGSNRVLRGGSWGINADYCRVAYRRDASPAIIDHIYGFRLAVSLS